ncbi:SGNH/GDSL hydrolase family protein [Alienimonas californiensis]|uniref:SGNH hydrolase-type esterase domain-containing protein n=1 Tax=Alienimonas californiensis TaxID=2527989 RepID=A0A517PFI1_9PLAN|nr:hypothetical protein [Alienimonas californiensis]QDT18130.1 hypothetical protein CA12_42700 [Alienimonas californiensis]
MPITLALACTALACGFADDAVPEPLLKPGDRVAFVGGSLWEAERRSGRFEAERTMNGPADVTFRHLGWAGDMADQSARRFFKTAKEGREHLLEHVDLVEPTVIFVAYGQAESLPGGMSVDDFEQNMESLLDELIKRTDRVVLVSPADAEPYAAAVRSIAGRRGLRVLTEEAVAKPLRSQRVAAAPIESLIREKNDLFFQRHRPQNETYLRGFRAHEQGNNAVEIEQFEPLVAAKDAEIQALRQEIVKAETE